jgi:hypothetical protein
MLLFRSEEHVERWRERRGIAPGAMLSLPQGWALARAWFHDRLSPDWRRKSPEEAHAIFKGIGLMGPFWNLTPEVSSADGVDTPGA